MSPVLGSLSVKIVDEGFDWTGWISTSAAIATLVIVGVTAVFALLGLRDARRTRHGQLVTEVMRDWNEPAVLHSLRLHSEFGETRIVALVDSMFKPGESATPEDRENWSALSLLANHIETLGVLVSEKAITAEVVYKMWGGAILFVWPKWDEAISNLRVYDAEPDTFEYFEKIYADVKRIRDKLHPPSGSG